MSITSTESPVTSTDPPARARAGAMHDTRPPSGASGDGSRPTRHVRAAIVGTGFSGLGMAIRGRDGLLGAAARRARVA